MARPIKKGLDYFPFDVDFFSDIKIRSLKGKYGTDGAILYIYLLTEIYKNGYYLPVDDDFIYVISDTLNMTDDKIGQIINFLLGRSLFDDTLFKSEKVLTSRSIQLRFQEAVKSRASKTPIEVGRFWILNENETQSFIKCTHFSDSSENNKSFSKNNESFSLEEPHKVKESKGKESRVKEIDTGPDTKASRTAAPYQSIQNLFNSICKSFPTVKKLSESRKKAIKARLNTYTVEDFKTLFLKAEASDFLKGKNQRNWMADFDWLIKDSNMTKTLEGKYDNDKSMQSKPINGQPAEIYSDPYDHEELERIWWDKLQKGETNNANT